MPSQAQEEIFPAFVADLGEDGELNVRVLPDVEANAIIQIPSFTPLVLLGRSPDQLWLQAETPEHIVGWVYRRYVETQINTQNLPVIVGFDQLIYGQFLSEEVQNSIREIALVGASRGQHVDIFAKVGDSITVSTHFMVGFGRRQVRLEAYEDQLHPVIDFFSPSAFTRRSEASGVGWAAFTLLDRIEEATESCFVSETPLECEYRIMQPAVSLIMLGTNDVGYVNGAQYRTNLNRIVEFSIERGIIPILSTIPNRLDRPEVTDRVPVFNQIISEIAHTHQIPLWDYHSAMQLLPEGGLTQDGIHPSSPAENAAFHLSETNLWAGYVIRNLTGLQMLRAVQPILAEAYLTSPE